MTNFFKSFFFQLVTRNAILRDDQEIIRIYRRMAIKDATKMVAQAEEGMKMTEQEERLANIMINGKSNLARNMAAEFMKRRDLQAYLQAIKPLKITYYSDAKLYPAKRPEEVTK